MECVLCQSDKFERLFNVDGYEIKKCQRCGLVRTFGKQRVDYHQYHRDEDYQQLEGYFKNIFRKRFDLISQRVKNGRVLDIGASTGVMLNLFKENGFETWGIEPSKSAEFARRKGHKIIKNTLEKAKLPKNHFDVVILNHTLEHVADPVSMLTKVKSVLFPGGLVYVDVPNFGSLAARVMNKNWSYLLPDEHIHHFTPETLKKILKKAGFKVVWGDTWSGVYDTGNMFTHFWLQLISGKLYMYKNFIFDLLGIPGNILSTSLNLGTSLAMIGKK